MPVDITPIDGPLYNRYSVDYKCMPVKLHAKYPKMVAIDNTTLNGFPIIRILDPVIFRDISSLILDDALGGEYTTTSGVLRQQFGVLLAASYLRRRL